MHANMVEERYDALTRRPSERSSAIGAGEHIGHRKTFSQRALRLGQRNVSLRLPRGGVHEHEFRRCFA